MKVNIDQTVEVTDEQRAKIAAALDGEGSRKRQATRDEMKEFIWNNGSEWAYILENGGQSDDLDLSGVTDEDLVEPVEEDSDEVLVGIPVTVDAELDDLL